ncbi:recombination regulator RecX [Hathewaya massiliensis]|uniref:recombination regulator RecX n=1 Tax=Hathewaya massiliensis TaxID=1964382 RepID=UPI0011581494|nr:recombination regulator RecX [Hathewaya massiliensis]
MSNKVSKIEVQKKNKERVNIYVDDEYFISCHMELIYKEGIKKGESIDKEKLNSIVEEDNFIKAKSRSLRYLGRAYKAEEEVREKLIGEGYDEKIIERTINFLKEYNFIDDNRYVELFIKEKLKKWGENRIKYELLKKGVDEKLIISKMEHIDEEDKENILSEIAIKKYNSLVKSEKDLFKVKKKLNDYLLRRGYNYDEVRAVIINILEVGE